MIATEEYQDGDILTTKQAARYMGYASRDSLYKPVRLGNLECITKDEGRIRIYFEFSVLQAFKESRRGWTSKQEKVVTGRKKCHNCRKFFKGRAMTYFKGHTLCRDCLCEDDPYSLEIYYNNQSSFSMIDCLDGEDVGHKGVMRDFRNEKETP